MLSGRRLDLLDPSPLDVEIEDIAHGLARVARWNGQTLGEHAYCVAQHSLAVEALVRQLTPGCPPLLALASLLHDAPEYVIGDMISPFKAVMGEQYKGVEARLTQAIHTRFALPAKLPSPWKAVIKRADGMSAYCEATVLAGFSASEAKRYFEEPPRLDRTLIDGLFDPWPTALAQERFLQRFYELQKAAQA